jgi:hypothetical protein
MSGAALRGADGADSVRDVAYARIFLDWYAFGDQWVRFPDVDGDGQDELIFSLLDTESGAQEAEVLFFDPSTVGTFSLGDALGGYTGGAEVDDFGWRLSPCEAFGADTIMAGDNLDTLAFPLPNAIPPRGTPIPERHLRFSGIGNSGNCRDATGDGIEDFATSTNSLNGDPAGFGVNLVPGWNLDWNDDALWAAP